MIGKNSMPQIGLVLLFGTIMLSTSLHAQMPIALSDTISFRSSEVGPTSNRFGIGNRIRASINHPEGISLIYQATGEFRNQSLRREFNELTVRHVALDGTVTQGQLLSRQFANGNQSFNGSRDWIAWTALESPLGSNAFPQLITEVYDHAGNSIARQEVMSFQSDLVELYATRTSTSRYGSYVVVAALTSRRKDRLAPREEAGANLTIACINAEGKFVYRHQYDLPDLRARYTLEGIRIDESQDALVLLARTPWRAMPPTFENPLIDNYEFLNINAETKSYEPIDALPQGYQSRGLFGLDQEPYPAGFAFAFASDLVESVAGFQLIHAGNPEPIQILLTPELVKKLPDVAIESTKGLNKHINGQYIPRELRYSPDGRLFALYADAFRPIAIQDAGIQQWRREADGLSDGVVLAEIDFSELSPKQSGHFLSLRQRYGSGLGSYFGSCLVPVNGGYGILFNEDPENLELGKRKRRPFTRMSFAKPFLAYLKDDQLTRLELDYQTPYRFGVLVNPSGRVLPDGKFISFSALEESFQYSEQYYFWPNEFVVEE